MRKKVRFCERLKRRRLLSGAAYHVGSAGTAIGCESSFRCGSLMMWVADHANQKRPGRLSEQPLETSIKAQQKRHVNHAAFESFVQDQSAPPQ